jgi:hypothetical protein
MRRPSVTQLVDFAKCEKLATLKISKAEPLNANRRQAVDHGLARHERFERQAVVDGRCFVASFAYGSDSLQAAALRAYRDEVLARSALGRLGIAAYYRLSPMAVGALRQIPQGLPLARWLVDAALRRVQKSRQGKRP